MSKRALVYQTLEDSLLGKTGPDFKLLIEKEDLSPAVCIELRNLLDSYKHKLDLFMGILDKQFEAKVAKLNETTPANETLFCKKIGRNFNNESKQN